MLQVILGPVSAFLVFDNLVSRKWLVVERNIHLVPKSLLPIFMYRESLPAILSSRVSKPLGFFFYLPEISLVESSGPGPDCRPNVRVQSLCLYLVQ